MIDFGYATFPNTRLPGQTGTPLFMSSTIQTVGAIEPCWKDDLESVGYILMYFMAKGKKGLPWGSFKSHKEISDLKTDEVIFQFCLSLKNTIYAPLSDSLYNFLALARNRASPLTQTEYRTIHESFQAILIQYGWTHDKCYDWCALTIY